VISVQDAKTSTFNSDVLDVEIKIAIASGTEKAGTIKFNEKDMSIMARGFNISPTKLDRKKLVIISQYDPGLPFSKIILSILIFLLASFLIWFSFFLYKKRAELNEKRNVREAKSMWAKNLLQAKSRFELEEIYKRREDWLRFIDDKTAADEFCKIINENQYKKSWEDKDLTKVKGALNTVRIGADHEL